MPTTHSDQFFVMDPGAPPPNGTALTVQNFNFVDNNDDGFISTTAGDTFNGGTITSVWVNDQIRVRLPDNSIVIITGVTFYVSGQPAVFTPTDGTVLQDATFLSSTYVTTSTQIAVGTLGPICFTPGTLIETEQGLRLIESLQPGDQVWTRDNGFQTLRWIGTEKARAEAEFAPVEFAAGVLGNRVPLVVSQQHRLLISGWRAQLFGGAEDLLVAAKHLVNGRDILLRPGGVVTYVHILFDHHEIVRAGGVWSESYFPAHAKERCTLPMQTGIEGLFPEMRELAEHVQTARCVARHFEASCLVA